MDEVIVQGGELSLRSEPERIISYRIMRWGELGDAGDGWESFERGAFEGTRPEDVYLRLDHLDPALARGVPGSLEERADGAYMDFGPVARTQKGDELLGLVRDGIYRNASVGFLPIPGGTRTSRHTDGRTLNVRTRVNLHEVGATWRPVFQSAAALSVRSSNMDPVTDTPAQAPAQVPPAAIQAVSDSFMDRVLTRLDEIELRSRQNATQPPAGQVVQAQRPSIGFWMLQAARQMDHENIPEMELRALAEIVTGTNLGVVPPAYASELIGPIDNARPFMESTRRLTTPESGTKLIVPRIVTRPTVGIQAAEKDELTSTNTAIDTVDFDMMTLGGAGDLSLQLIKRSSPSFLDTYSRLLAEDYAHKGDRYAITDLLRAGIDDGGVFNPASPAFGLAYSNATNAMRTPPNRIWMSSAAYAAFVDAKEPAGGGGRPLYPGLAGISSVSAGGPSGPDNMNLQPVLVPELDVLKAGTLPSGVTEVPDLIIGPSAGFAWAEDGTYNLQADNPGQAGRDVALVGMLWFAALYPGAFTGYTLS